MLTIRKSHERGHAEHGWLNTYHTFSFDTYYDPEHDGFRSLRVINEDIIAGNQGFGMHPHSDMEIITYVLEGELTHKDSVGNEGIIRTGEIQIMSAGSGVSHSEFNNQLMPCHLLQIWLFANEQGLMPRYATRKINWLKNELTPIVDSSDVYQDAKVYVCKLTKPLIYDSSKDRGVWIQLIDGEMDVNGMPLEKGDGIAIEDEKDISMNPVGTAHFLLFDLA